MTPDEVSDRIRTGLGERLRNLQRPTSNRLYFDVDPEVIPDTALLLLDDLQARFQTASGVDAPGEIEILYHWALDPTGVVVSLRTLLPRDEPEIESITGLCAAAEWVEREMWELLGIRFRNHPDLRHLLLDDDWPEGRYPLRRDYDRGEGNGEGNG